MSTPHAPTSGSGPEIRLSPGRGQGPTPLAAFDAALVSAGLAGFNLVRLSSVIPVGASVQVVEPDDQLQGRHGDLLYCVYACASATRPGSQGWAGIAWALRTDGSGAGLFVEHHADSCEVVEADLGATLGAMICSRAEQRGEEYVPAGRLLADVTCREDPVTAVVVASYRAVGWGDPLLPGTSPAGVAR